MLKRSCMIIFLSFLYTLPSCFDDKGSSDVSREAAFKKKVDAAYSAATWVRGVSVAINVDGASLWRYARGDAGGGETMDISTHTFAYSITKTVVSALVLSQIEDGLYAFDDTVSGLLDTSGMDEADINVDATVEDLLTHTSGMPDYAYNIDALIGLCDPGLSWTPDYILDNVVYLPFSSDNFDTGTFEYSNTNYILLGMIAEEAGGDTLNDLLRDTFFTPLDIGLVLAPQDAVPGDMAHPHDMAALFGPAYASYGFIDIVAVMPYVFTGYDYYLGTGRGTWAAGGIIATAGDLAEWGYELYSADGIAVSQDVRNTLKASAPAGGTYGYGITRVDFTYDDGTAGVIYGHDGSAPGYKTLLRYEETEDIAVAIITNANNSVDGTGLLDRVSLAEDLVNVYKTYKDSEEAP